MPEEVRPQCQVSELSLGRVGKRVGAVGSGRAQAELTPSFPAACRPRWQRPPVSVPRDTRATASTVQVGSRGMLRAPTLPFSVKFHPETPCRPLSGSSGASVYPGPISGLTLPSDLFLSPEPSSPVPALPLCLLLTAIWDPLPLELDPCAQDRGGCSPHANCTKVAPGQRTCTCQDGYAGDGELCQGEVGPPTVGGHGAGALASVL